MALAQSLWYRLTGGDEPAGSLFRQIRWRMTLWYSGVLAAALLIFGVALYLSVSHTLMNSVDDRLQQEANAEAPLCYQAFPGLPGRQLPQGFIACYDLSGKLNNWGTELSQFLDPSLAKETVSSGDPAHDIVTVQSRYETIQVRRATYPLFDTSRGIQIGAIQVGAQVDAELHSLHVLLELLILFGLIALVLASIGGLFLANRALLPARLAYSRQRDFIADASHELRTPLTMLRADAEVLLRDRRRLAPDDVAILEDMVAETTHMASLASNMLDLARLDTNSAHLERDVVDLSSLAAEIAHRIHALAAERGIAVHADAAAPVLVVGDRMLLEQAALVLIDNAVKYNRTGGEVLVRVALAGEMATLEVRDTGIGIAAEHLPRLGERFYRVDKARSREMGGAGLGISIVQTIAARHGGTFRLDSEPERGTVARLTLPAARERVAISVPAP